MIEQVRKKIKEDPSVENEWDNYLQEMMQTLKLKNVQAVVNWVQLGNGHLAIGHRPGKKISYEGLKKAGTSIVVTLLHENEGALPIGKHIHDVNMEWIWFPFSASKPHSGEELIMVVDLFNKLSHGLDSGKKIYIHCSAGIHRTGMIAYGLLRFLGKDKPEALKLLESLRMVTSMQVGENRLLWADQFKKNPQEDNNSV
ncbi:MAG: hypothetical protein ABIN48_00080 [Ginsengibacter sp.]